MCLRSITEDKQQTQPHTIQTLLFQPLKQLGTLIQLFAKALCNTIIHFAGLQELLKSSDQIGQVLAVSCTDAVDLLNFLTLVRLLMYWRVDWGIVPLKKGGKPEADFRKKMHPAFQS